MKQFLQKYRYLIFAVLVLVIAGTVVIAVRLQQAGTSLTFRLLHQDVIINADLWSDKPEILSAGYGFDGIIGVDGGEKEVRDAGGTWNTVTCANGQEPPRNVLTSSSTPTNVVNAFD